MTTTIAVPGKSIGATRFTCKKCGCVFDTTEARLHQATDKTTLYCPCPQAGCGSNCEIDFGPNNVKPTTLAVSTNIGG